MVTYRSTLEHILVINLINVIYVVECFSQNQSLQYHIRTHTGDKVYSTCDICGKVFSQNGNLQYHIRTNTGDKPYKYDIPVCGKGFNQNSIL
jgi:KRAB domain-containing zinc finger protein